MRVIAGSARGRTLKGPPRASKPGRPGIRPSSDLIRGVVFDMLDALGADYARVLDLYAGTGALGIEALSRGDGTAVFIDEAAEAVAVIRANLDVTGFAGRAQVLRLPAESAASRLEGVFTLVLADPPYYDEDAFAAVRAIAASALVTGETVVAVEHHRKVAPPDALGALPLYRSRRHGDTVVSIYAQEDVS
jgi:16S rRNA (guanine(966)-N(2))-methyltransferase RsmD